MTTATFIGLALAYSLAFLRLARVIQPSYRYFPAWAQVGLTVLVAAVSVFSDSLGNDQSKLDVAESLLLAAVAALAAWKGRKAVVLAILILLPLPVSACGSLSSYRLPASDPCSLENPEFVQLITECDVKIAECPRDAQGKVRDATCPALRECEDRKAKACA